MSYQDDATVRSNELTTPRSGRMTNDLIGNADDSTFIAVVPSSSVKVTVAESLSRDLVMVSEWCDLWG